MINKKGESKSIILLTIFLLFIILVAGLFDELYLLPKAAESANQMCKEQGYDFYESFKRIGLFSTTPVAVECKYVENYKEMDIILRQIYGGGLAELNKTEDNN